MVRASAVGNPAQGETRGVREMRSDERVNDVHCDDHHLIADLKDGRTISVPIAWYPRLFNATFEQHAHWEPCGGGYGIHWPDIDEHLSSEGLLRGAPAPGLKAA
jgi:hypothetical protein